jgi:hypothetical protein
MFFLFKSLFSYLCFFLSYFVLLLSRNSNIKSFYSPKLAIRYANSKTFEWYGYHLDVEEEKCAGNNKNNRNNDDGDFHMIKEEKYYIYAY